jgi:type I restriction enzyme S subunit
VYGANGRIGWHNEALVKGPGIVVGRKGNPGVVTWASTDFYPIDTTYYVVPKDNFLSLHYLYFTLTTLDLSRLTADSAVPGLNRNHAYMSEVIAPPDQLLRRFESVVSSLFAKTYLNESQNMTLAALRDTLLPRLLSGELRVPDATAVVAQGV